MRHDGLSVLANLGCAEYKESRYCCAAEAEKRAILKSFIAKLTAELKPKSLFQIASESAGFVRGVAVKLDRLDDLETKMRAAEKRFGLFTLPPESDVDEEIEAEAKDTPAP